MGRVLAVGIDSGAIGLIEELGAAGLLPSFEQTRRRSARLRLHSDPNHRHGMLWTQFISGRAVAADRPGFRCTFDPDTYEPFEESAHHDFQGDGPFWERSGAQTITLDVPRSTISGPGVHVTAWGAHAPTYPRASRPRGLLREIDARFGTHPACENEYECGWHDPDRLDRLTEALEVGAPRRAEVATFLMRRFPDWRLFVTVMSESHSASEMLWHGIDPTHPLARYDPDARARLTRVFVAMDRALGTLIAALGPDDSLVVFSLDGMKPSHGDLPSIVLLPELLHRRHFGTKLLEDPDPDGWRRAGCPPLVPRRGVLWRHDLDRRLVHPPPMSWRRHVQRIPAYESARLTRPGRWVVERVKHEHLGALGRPIPAESEELTTAIEHHRQRLDEILFVGNYCQYRSRLRSFVLPSFGDGYLRINLQGRERDGRVTIAEYDDERRALDALVGACRNPRTGAPVTTGIEWFETRTLQEAVDRPYADGVVPWTDPTDAFEHPELGVIGPFPLHRTGTHSDVGFAWVSGPRVVPGELADRSVLDLPPTILRTLDADASLPAAGTPIELDN